MNIQECFVLAFNDHSSASQGDDLEKPGTCPCLAKGSEAGKHTKIETLKALRYAQVCNSS